MNRIGRLIAKLSGVDIADDNTSAGIQEQSDHRELASSRITDSGANTHSMDDSDLSVPDSPNARPPVYEHVPHPVIVPAKPIRAKRFVNTLHHPLFYLTKHDPICTAHVLSHTLVLGGTGMGKSSGSDLSPLIRAIAKWSFPPLD